MSKSVIIFLIIWTAGAPVATYFITNHLATTRTNREIKKAREASEASDKRHQEIEDSIAKENVFLLSQIREYHDFSDSMIKVINKRSPGIVLLKTPNDSVIGSLDVMAQLKAYTDFLMQTDSL